MRKTAARTSARPAISHGERCKYHWGWDSSGSAHPSKTTTIWYSESDRGCPAACDLSPVRVPDTSWLRARAAASGRDEMAPKTRVSFNRSRIGTRRRKRSMRSREKMRATPMYRVSAARAVNTAERARAGLPLLPARKDSIGIRARRMNRLKRGSLKRVEAKWARGRPAMTATAAPKATSRDLRRRLSQRPVARMIRPKAAAFRSRPPSTGSMPNRLRKAIAMEKKGAKRTICSPPGDSRPSPAVRLSAAAR